VADPSVETWRATLGQSTSAQLRRRTAEVCELTAVLLETRQSLAASQADLTRVEAKCDALAVLNAELRAEAANWREIAERYLARTDEQGHALAAANHRNRILTAENEAALRRLNEQRIQLAGTVEFAAAYQPGERDWQVADRDTGIACESCAGPIMRGQALQPLADAKGFFVHVACPPSEEAL